MDQGDTTPRVVRFGVFELDRRSGELRKEGVRVRLQEQPLRVLDALLSEPGEPVTREVLRQRLWPDETFVDFDNGLNRAINRLRAALGDEAGSPRFIETLDRRGYRFIAPVGGVDAPAATRPPAAATSAARWKSPAGWIAASVAVMGLVAAAIALGPARWRTTGPADRTPMGLLAVLPLANLTGDPAQEYFSDGMTDALITNLASLPALRVISRQSVMRYKGSAKPLPEIARELGVEGVVEGSVVRSGGRVRINAQLIHAATDRHLWARSFERRLEDVLVLQGEVSRAIAAEVLATVGASDLRRPARERAVKPDAYDAYLLGMYQWNQRTAPSLDRALAHFRAAIAIDPDFAPAHAGLAIAYGPRLVFGYVPPGQGLPELKAAALRALELDPGLGDARAALAAARAQDWDWDGAEAEFRKAVDTDPGSAVAHLWYAWYLHARGRFEEALAERRRSLELDPLSSSVNRGMAHDFEAIGQDEAALRQLTRVLELDPDQAQAHLRVALFHVQHGRPDLGRRHLERARALGVEDPLGLAYLAIIEAESGNPHEVRRALGRLRTESSRQYVSPVLPAFVHAALGEVDSAFRLLENAYAAKDPMLIPIQACETGSGLRLPDRWAVRLRADPRFGSLVRRMGLVPAAR